MADILDEWELAVNGAAGQTHLKFERV